MGPNCLPSTRRRLPAVLLLLLALPVAAGGQQYVEISAEIEMKAWRGEDSAGEANAKVKSVSVRCVTGTNLWRIEDNRLQGGEVKWFYDGTNVYQSMRQTEPTPRETIELVRKTSGLATAPFEQVRSNISISIWPCPDGLLLGDAGANIPWLAFCSGTYLRRAGRLVPLPVEDLHHTRDRFGYSDKTETFPDEFGLPRKVELFTSRSLFLASEAGFDKECFFGDRYTDYTRKTAAGLQEGVLTFHYAVLEFTNFLGWTFPTKFEFFQKGRAYEQNGNWFHRGTGTVKSIRASAPPENLFVPALQQSIIDWRFRDESNRVDALIYTSTNNFAAPTNDPVLQEKFAARVARMVEDRARRGQ